MLQQGENIKLISERLGHSSVKITLDTYSHVFTKHAKRSTQPSNTTAF
ncbi:hypothetical protein ACW6U8_05330 [Bacillus subtilis]